MSDSAAPDGSRFQMMHTMVRVKDLDKSIDFYTRLLGMTLLRKMDFPDGEFTLAFVGSVISETVAANAGLGHMMLSAQSQFNVPLIFAGLVALAVEGIVMYAIMAEIEKRTTGWAHRSERRP